MDNTVDKKKRSNASPEEGKYYKLRLIGYRMRHGLVLFSILNFLRRFGVYINPYWVDLESLAFCPEPSLKDDPGLYHLDSINKEDVLLLYHQLRWNTDTLTDHIKSEFRGVGLYRNEELEAFMMIRTKSFAFFGKEFQLGQNEAYLENMYTYEKFRGKNLAPYLRYQCYKLLAAEGRTNCYSITQYFNTSSRKFKAKLGAKPSELWLHLGLSKKLHRTILLKKYTV